MLVHFNTASKKGRPEAALKRRKSRAKARPPQEKQKLRLGVGAALERRAVGVAAAGVGAGGVLLGLLGFGAEGGLAGGAIRPLAGVTDVREAGFAASSFEGGLHV